MALPVLAAKALLKKPSQKNESNLATVMVAGGLGLGVFLGVRALAKRFKKDLASRQVLSKGSAQGYASRLKMAFDNDNTFGWGTDEELVFRTLEQVPSSAVMRKVQRAYRDLYGRHLSADLQDELSSQEYGAALQIINAKN